MTAKSILVITAVSVIIIAVSVLIFIVHGNNVISGGGSGQSYLSQSEMQSLFGQGAYFASGSANATSNGQQLSNFSIRANAGYLYHNITSYWTVSYNITGHTVQFPTGSWFLPNVYEQVFGTQVPSYIYSTMVGLNIVMLSKESSAYDVNVTIMKLNVTVGSMLYSYLQGNSTEAGAVPAIILIGKKGNEVAFVSVFGKNVSIQTLANTIASDLP